MTLRTLIFSAALTLAGLATYAQTTSTPTATTATESANLQAYAGTYTFESGSPLSTYTITVKEGSLHGDAGMGEYKLLKQEKSDEFKSTSSYGSIITFTRDATTKKVTGLTLAAQGQELTATRGK